MKKRHICFVRPKNSTSEHAENLARQCESSGITFCFINFERPVYLKHLNWFFKYKFLLHMKLRKSSFIFLNTPYPDHFPKWFNQGNFPFAYSGYGLPMSTWEYGQFSTPLIVKTKLLMAGSTYELEGYSKAKKENQLVVFTGNPLMWTLRKDLKSYSKPRFNQTRFLWAPHWSQNWFEESRGFSRWRESLEAVQKFALLNSNVRVVIRPHPILLAALRKSKVTENTIIKREVSSITKFENHETYFNAFAELTNLPNVELSSNTLIEDIINSDFLLTEGISIIGYWSATGKPIAVYRDHDSPQFNEIGNKLLKFSDIVKNSREISNWLSIQAENKSTTKKLEQIQLVNELFPTFEKSPFSIALDQWINRSV